MKGLVAALAIARKDLRTELRTKESFNSSLSFSVVILVLFSFAFDLDRESFYAISGGMLWLVFSFARALIVNRSFARELPNDCLDVLIASPAPGWAIYLGKTIAAFVTLLMVEFISLPIFGLFYNIAWWHSPLMLALVIILSTWGIAIVGVGFSAVTVNVRLRELMLPVLLYPILIPVLLGAMGTCTALFSGDPGAAGNAGALQLLVVFDIVYTAAGLYMIESILVI
jgi:heme exporter protein B